MDQTGALQTGIFQSLNLLLDDELESSGTDEQGRRRSRRVVQDSPDVRVLNVLERIHSLNAVGVQFVEHEADTSTTRQLSARELLVVTLQDRAVFVAELGDDVEDDVRTVAQEGVAQLRQFGLVLREGALDTGLDFGKRILNVHHKDLEHRQFRCRYFGGWLE